MDCDDEAYSVSRADVPVDASSDDFEHVLDKALSEEDSRFIPDLMEGNEQLEEHEQLEPPVPDGAAFHKAAPPSDRRPMSYASIPDRRLAGHHLDANNVSPVTYSRDGLTRVLAIEHRMIKDMSASAGRLGCS